MRVILSPELDDNRATEPRGRLYTAVLFRGTIYVATPRHMDALNLIFEGMSEHTQHRLHLRIAERKEPLVFGHSMIDGSHWQPVDCNEARMTMYGFEEPYPE